MPIIRNAEIRDIIFLWRLRNEPEVRKNSFNSQPVRFLEHLIWFTKTLKSSKRILLIINDNENKIGQIRFDLSANADEADISLSISDKYRNQSYTSWAIETGSKRLLNDFIQINKIVAKVKHSNLASQRALVVSGYVFKEANDDYLSFEYLRI
jgi:RimJ/RimL family protein N-acetyltransferase